MALPEGLYDLLLAQGLASRLDLSRANVLALKEGAAQAPSGHSGRCGGRRA